MFMTTAITSGSESSGWRLAAGTGVPARKAEAIS